MLINKKIITIESDINNDEQVRAKMGGTVERMHCQITESYIYKAQCI